jgi:hypothetical protein
MVPGVSIDLDRAALLAFRERRWDLVHESKLAHWAEQTRIKGPLAGLQASAALWVHARTVDPTWPSEHERREDFEHHVELAAKLRRIAHVFTRQ